ncbi:outer membrane protein [Rhodobaculum claviforme]|uniref:Outer membrane protein beta-barrel domain-containing protein n=1 Tax=Rhodobaculum claviforme TaxID=1549854 RepID=A0A934TKX8_9RHOB|nr:outer membrane beta-barrel protein [Rhodobaculum claviforme]MBK5927341.1 hypothetical protein [Rhodobaculum claviforme]
MKRFIGLGAPVLAAAMAMAPAASAQGLSDGWAGAWVGGALGAGSTNYSLRGSAVENGSTLGTLRLPDFGGEGGLVSLSGGYDFAVSDTVVMGLMADITATGINNRANLNADGISFNYKLRPRTIYSAAGRVGLMTSDSTMVYGLLGVSQARFRASGSATAGTDTLLDGGYKWKQSGPVIGAGIETRLADNMTLRMEYRYYRLGTQNIINEQFLGTTLDAGSRTSIQTVQAGVNWRF